MQAFYGIEDMVDIFIPNKTIYGRPVNSPGHPSHGRILFSNPSGEVGPSDPLPEPEPGYGLQWPEFTGETPVGVGVRDAGFFPIIEHADTKKIYIAEYPYEYNGTTVFPTDTNDGLTPLTPKKSVWNRSGGQGGLQIAEAGRSCHIFLRTDDAHEDWEYNFSDSGTGSSDIARNLSGGESFEKPWVITWFGPGKKRPKARAPIALSFGTKNLWIDGIHFYQREQDISLPTFDIENSSQGKLQFLNSGACNVLIQDCEFTGVEITVQNQDDSGMDNFIIHRNIGHYNFYRQSAYNNNIRPSFSYTSLTTGLKFTENLMKWSGWHPDVPTASSNQFNHGLYMGETNGILRIDDLEVKRNIIFRPSAHSWQMRGGGTAEDNICIGQAVGPSFGYLDINNVGKGYLPDGSQCISRRNIVLKTTSMHRTPGGCNGGVCTTARWGFNFTVQNTNVDYLSDGDVIAYTEDTGIEPGINSHSITYRIPDTSIFLSEAQLIADYPEYWALITIKDRVLYHYDSPTQGDDLNLLDPTRDIGKYFSMLSGDVMTDLEGIEFLESRPKSSWDSSYAPATIHDWIYKGYQPVGEV